MNVNFWHSVCLPVCCDELIELRWAERVDCGRKPLRREVMCSAGTGANNEKAQEVWTMAACILISEHASVQWPKSLGGIKLVIYKSTWVVGFRRLDWWNGRTPWRMSMCTSRTLYWLAPCWRFLTHRRSHGSPPSEIFILDIYYYCHIAHILVVMDCCHFRSTWYISEYDISERDVSEYDLGIWGWR